MDLNSAQRFCVYKIHRTNDPAKAAKYFAALVGSGLKPGDLPSQIIEKWRALSLAYRDGAVSYPPHKRGYDTREAWKVIRVKAPEFLGLSAEITLAAILG